MSRRWEDTLDEALDLRDWWKSRMGQLYAKGFEADKKAKDDIDPVDIASLESWKLGVAEPFYVDPQMMDLIDVAVETFRPERLLREDLVTQYGWMVFPRPLYGEDVHGKMCAVSAMCWAPSKTPKEEFGIHLSTYTHADDRDESMDEVRETLRERGMSPHALGKWSLHHHQFWAFDQDPFDLVVKHAHAGVLRSIAQIEREGGIVDETKWDQAKLANGKARIATKQSRRLLDQSQDIVDEDPEAALELMVEAMDLIETAKDTSSEARDILESAFSPEALRRVYARTVLPYQAIFRLIQQQIASRRPTRLPGPFAKRARHASRVEEVTVVTLRRPRQPQREGDSQNVAWDHRWLVRPHWRNQWYPSLGQHRQVWIAPFVKGPADKPLVVTRRVFEVVR